METKANNAIQGYIFYDDECAFCRGWVVRLHRIMLGAGYHFVPMQAAWALNALGATEPSELNEMKLLRSDGRICGGVDAYAVMAAAVWYFYPISILLKLPGIHQIARLVYRRIAANRGCIAGVCKMHSGLQRHDGYARRVFLDAPC